MEFIIIVQFILDMELVSTFKWYAVPLNYIMQNIFNIWLKFWFVVDAH